MKKNGLSQKKIKQLFLKGESPTLIDLLGFLDHDNLLVNGLYRIVKTKNIQ